METLSTIPAHSGTYILDPDSIGMELQQVELILEPGEVAFEIGAWLAGIECFMGSGRDMFAAESASSAQDLRREFRIGNAAFLQISKLIFRLRRTMSSPDSVTVADISRAELDRFSMILRRAIIMGESHSASNRLTLAEWQAWADLIMTDLLGNGTAFRFMSYSLASGYGSLPAAMRDIFERPEVEVADRVDFRDVVPRVATALRYLEIVGRMMRQDEPLKPSVLLLSAVHEQARQMIDHINDRLERFPNEEAALFNSLDSASYSASLELKKVFRQELRGIVGILPPTSVFARIETAYSLLLDSFQQILLDLARSVDPKVTLFDFFPRFQIKLDQSLILRDHLWQILKAVRSAEESPEKANVDHLKQELADFVTITIRFLHYKDEETFERFNEEVYAARDKKDLVPILHRFGAYLETLFGQVCMRGVLADHPFQNGN